MRANETYSEVKSQFSVKSRDVLMNAQFPHKWWFILKSAVFGLSSSLKQLIGEGGGLLHESVGKTDLLSDHFDEKQSRESVDCITHTIRFLDSPSLPSGRVRSGVSC